VEPTEVTAASGDEEMEEVAAESEKGLQDDFCIVNLSGVHKVGLDFCSCSLAEPHDVQLTSQARRMIRHWAMVLPSSLQ
jgi:hypothetical protein